MTDALRASVDRGTEITYRLGVEGYDELHWYQDGIAGYERKHSESMLQWFAERMDPDEDEDPEEQETPVTTSASIPAGELVILVKQLEPGFRLRSPVGMSDGWGTPCRGFSDTLDEGHSRSAGEYFTGE